MGKRLEEEAGGFFQVAFDFVDELGGVGAVDDAVVGGDGALHDVGDGDLAVTDHGLLSYAAHGDAGALLGIDDGDEIVDLEHAEVAYGDGGLGVLLGLEDAVAGSGAQVPAGRRDIFQALASAVEDGGGDEAVFQRYGDADVERGLCFILPSA